MGTPTQAPLATTSVDTVVQRLAETRVLPVVTIEDADHVEPLVAALKTAQLPCIEIAFRTDAAAEAIRRARALGGMLVGAGTVLTPEQAREAAACGADFAVAPGLNEHVVAACTQQQLPFFPGVATPSEADHARSLGLRVLKVFPIAQLGGPAFLRALSSVYRDVRLLPTGGIDAAALPDYLRQPSVLAVGGSWMVTAALLNEKRFDRIEQLARDAVAVSREEV